MTGAAAFDARFLQEFERLIRWRRDVRRFRPDPLDPAVVEALLGLACFSPSVGNSQPWRFVLVAEPERRRRITEEFEMSNRQAHAGYAGGRHDAYARLKLAGLREAPVHLAAFSVPDPAEGHGLGRQTMPETVDYSVVLAIHTLWLAARARGIGLGWVSILRPERLAGILDVPAEWRPIGYFCLGLPEEEHCDPELERHGWQARLAPAACILRR